MKQAPACSVRLHALLAAYLWIVAAVPLGNWNRQRGQRLLPALLDGGGIGADDLCMLAFVALPAVLFRVAFRRRSVWFAAVALAVDAVWLWMQVQSWWIPYIFGARFQWQIDYAHGPTTKVLPSFGSHVAPDGMHFAIQILLIAAMVAGGLAMRQFVSAKAAARAALAGNDGVLS